MIKLVVIQHSKVYCSSYLESVTQCNLSTLSVPDEDNKKIATLCQCSSLRENGCLFLPGISVYTYKWNRAILFNKLKNYVVTIELILAGDENLTPNQSIEIFSAL